MPADEHVKQLAQEQVRVTGEPLQHAILDRLADPDPERPLAPVTGDQVEFEARIMEELVRAGGFYWAHPFGIKGVWREQGKTIIALDHQTLVNGTTHPMSRFAIQELLPDLASDTEVSGVVGLRVAEISGKGRRDLELIQVDAPGRVVLRASKGTQWRQILDDHLAQGRSYGSQPLWHERRITTHEVTQRSLYPLATTQRDSLAWLGASLLRRINLFYSVSTAHTTKSWVNGDRWIFEMDTLRRAGHPHDAFLAHLTDQRLGLALEFVDTRCTCRDVDPRDESHCSFRLHPTDGSRGILELRFRWLHPSDEDTRSNYERVHAAKDWLDRVLPTPEPGTRPGEAYQHMLDRLFGGTNR